QIAVDDGAVLRIDDHPVEAGPAHELSGQAPREDGPAAERRAALGQRLADAIHRHPATVEITRAGQACTASDTRSCRSAGGDASSRRTMPSSSCPNTSGQAMTQAPLPMHLSRSMFTSIGFL